jgi:hypothetical protein
MEEKRVVIKCVDMREDLQSEAIQCASEVRFVVGPFRCDGLISHH